MKVKVYRNLASQYRKGPPVYSVMAAEGANKGRVIAHARAVLVEGVRFTVNAEIRARVVATRHKEVHAYVVGRLDALDTVAAFHGFRDDYCSLDLPCNRRQARAVVSRGKAARYNPYEVETFVAEGAPLAEAEWAHLGPKGIHFANPTMDHGWPQEAE